MGTRYFFSSSSQITNDVSLKEKRLTIDNTTLILPCVDEWDLNAQLQSHDKQITQLLLKKYEGINNYLTSYQVKNLEIILLV